MTISTSNAPTGAQVHTDGVTPATEPLIPAPPPAPPPTATPVTAQLPRTLWSRAIILMLCLAVVTTTLAFGTVHEWSLAVFQLSASVVFALWMFDAFATRTLRVSRNLLQLPLLGLFFVGIVQIWPMGAVQDFAGALAFKPAATISFDPHATETVLLQIAGLVIYFAAALAFIDSPRVERDR